MTEAELRALLVSVTERSVAYRASAASRPHRPDKTYAEMRTLFDGPAPQRGLPIGDVIDALGDTAEQGLANMIGPRFFGWVIGATAPAGMAADWLVSAYGQNATNAMATPAAAACEEIVGRWLVELMGLPRESSVGFVTGGTMANFTCLAAARGEVLRRAGWDVESDGLFGAPAINVVLGEEAHSTVFSALRYLGLGAKRVVAVPIDAQGRMRANAFVQTLARLDGPTIAIAQAGHINSGAFDPIDEIAAACRAKGAWLHIDGAIGLWACAVPEFAHLTAGVNQADSWGADGHKWLQTPHDCGYAIVRDAAAHRRAMRIAASYLPEGDARHPADYAPELSKRARGFPTWAMLKTLGREGLAEMVSRHCALARRMAERLSAEGDVEVLNEVVLNQVAVRLGRDMEGATSDTLTERTIARVQREGVCFVGGAHWRDRQIIRVSVIGADTTEADIDASADAILSAWRAERGA
ncbi:aromatic-L-amino-acid decarboxylase [alpha proteobacterium U9-1i]|nr:aromatic-L-amino-acid decarboxylase [alpha proteobacterium U9-1i]